MMRDFVQHDAPDLAPQPLRVGSIQTLQRPAEDRDLVGQRAGVKGTAVRERHALVEAEEGHARRRLLLDDNLHVGHELAELWRQQVERVTNGLVELHLAPGYAASGSSGSERTREPVAAKRALAREGATHTIGGSPAA